MDYRTHRELMIIQARMPEYLKRNLLKVTEDRAALDRALEVIDDKRASKEDKRYVRAMIARGAFKPHREEMLDPEIERQIDMYYDREIRRAVAEGRITDPKDDHDSFLQKHQAKR